MTDESSWVAACHLGPLSFMSCRSRAESLARSLHSKLKLLSGGSEEDDPLAAPHATPALLNGFHSSDINNKHDESSQAVDGHTETCRLLPAVLPDRTDHPLPSLLLLRDEDELFYDFDLETPTSPVTVTDDPHDGLGSLDVRIPSWAFRHDNSMLSLAPEMGPACTRQPRAIVKDEARRTSQERGGRRSCDDNPFSSSFTSFTNPWCDGQPAPVRVLNSPGEELQESAYCSGGEQECRALEQGHNDDPRIFTVNAALALADTHNEEDDEEEEEVFSECREHVNGEYDETEEEASRDGKGKSIPEPTSPSVSVVARAMNSDLLDDSESIPLHGTKTNVVNGRATYDPYNDGVNIDSELFFEFDDIEFFPVLHNKNLSAEGQTEQVVISSDNETKRVKEALESHCVAFNNGRNHRTLEEDQTVSEEIFDLDLPKETLEEDEEDEEDDDEYIHSPTWGTLKRIDRFQVRKLKKDDDSNGSNNGDENAEEEVENAEDELEEEVECEATEPELKTEISVSEKDTLSEAAVNLEASPIEVSTCVDESPLVTVPSVQLRAKSPENKLLLDPECFTSNEDDSPRKIYRSSSLRSGKTPPGTPSIKKIVRFADVLGLDLEDIRHVFLDDLPTVPQSAYSDLDETVLQEDFPDGVGIPYPTSENRLPSSSVPIPRQPRISLICMFSQPNAATDFLERLRDQKVSLENAVYLDSAIKGSIRVVNLDFHKTVYVRYTFNEWKTHVDLQATYIPDSNDGITDRFSFCIFGGDNLGVGERLIFCIRFDVSNQQYWDNNNGNNYFFQCIKESLPLPPSPIDDWIHFV